MIKSTNMSLKHSSSQGVFLRPRWKMCSEHINNWQFLSPGDLEQNALFPKTTSWGFLVPNEGNWPIGGEFTLFR